MGTDLGKGATFAEISEFQHDLTGIISAPRTKIVKHITILRQEAIGKDDKDISATPDLGDIGDNIVVFRLL